eukprot:254643-Rhodomonas_salina.2
MVVPGCEAGAACRGQKGRTSDPGIVFPSAQYAMLDTDVANGAQSTSDLRSRPETAVRTPMSMATVDSPGSYAPAVSHASVPTRYVHSSTQLVWDLSFSLSHTAPTPTLEICTSLHSTDR